MQRIIAFVLLAAAQKRAALCKEVLPFSGRFLHFGDKGVAFTAGRSGQKGEKTSQNWPKGSRKDSVLAWIRGKKGRILVK